MATPDERFRLINDLHTHAVKVWDYVLLTPAKNVHITVGTIVLGVLGIALSFIIARRISAFLSRAAERRFQLAVGHAVFVDKLAYYVLATLFTLTVLNWLSIPLTVFAFVGTALAIGVGFGTQTLMNSFISGIILLFERTVRVGDIIEVNGETGTVTQLGTRCSRVRKGNGVELIVPNSLFLSNTVVNWTLSDPNHCYEISVGLAYGTDSAQAIALLQRVVTEQPEVLKTPAPAVYFDSFGDSALTFTIVYWLATNGPNTRKVASDMRLKIDRLCREAGIEIPFPQRDVNLHAAQPLEIKVIPPAS